ncbi:MAG TPA: hypothetical protein EYP41_09300 [Anaerolineae bacterium]|nr:hypothetical protein [Anaerolineae bacterium]
MNRIIDRSKHINPAIIYAAFSHRERVLDRCQPKTLELKVGAIIWATGWRPYDANNQRGHSRFFSFLF